MSIQYLLSGSPNDAFYSQIAFFRASLDSLGTQGINSRVTAIFGSETQDPLPPRWRSAFERIEVIYADPDRFIRDGFYAASDMRFELIDPDVDVAILCDADTAMMQPLPDNFLIKMHDEPAIGAVIAHYSFPVSTDSRPVHGAAGLYPGMPAAESWQQLGQLLLERPIDLNYTHPLPSGNDPQRPYDRCPFYPNHAFVAGPPRLLTSLYEQMTPLYEPLEELLGNWFYGQVAIALAVEKASLPVRELPMRYNFANDRRSDEAEPDELRNVVLMHYLRTELFDRHQIFGDPEAFDRFLNLDLVGSDRIFQDHVASVTNGSYPFDPLS